MVSRLWLTFVVCSMAVVAVGCGSTEESAQDPITAVSADRRDEVAAAQNVDPARFPKPRPGETIEAFAARFDATGPQAIAGTSVYRVPTARIAFGLLDAQQKFNYGPTVVYLERRGTTKVLGPFAAPADVLLTEPKYRSEQAATEDDPFAAIYAAEVPVSRPGIYKVLAVSDIGGRRIAAGMAAQVVTKAADPIPDVGERAPRVQTDTRATVKGNLDLLSTRRPPAPELAEKSFADVVGKKPVALLFATPQLCQSRVCGPVTDEMLQLKAKYGDKMTFIHQEPYLENNLQKGFRPQVAAFRLPSEPWLFTVDAGGRIAARLEGSIGIRAFEDAVKAALEQ